MEIYLSLYDDKFILHFGDILYWINQTRDRVHPANSKFSLYARTMDALDFICTFLRYRDVGTGHALYLQSTS
ncbi:MAG: hypothetical protein AAFS00_18480 [Bacteroidota bacterium]